MWVSQQNLSFLKKYRSSDPNFSTPVRQPRQLFAPPAVRRPSKDDDTLARTREYNETTETEGAPSASEVFSDIVSSDDLPTPVPEASGLYPATGVREISDAYPNFMRKLKNSNYGIINSLGVLYSKMRCQLTDCVAISNGVSNISNTLRQEGKFLKPLGGSAKVDDSLEDYVVIMTLKVVNPNTINEDTVTQSIKVLRGDVDVEPESINGKQWIRFKKVGNQITVPWSPYEVEKNVNDKTTYETPTGSNSSIIIKIGRNTKEDVNYAKLSSFMYEHVNCKSTILNGKHVIDAIKTFLYACSENINYICLDDATYDVLQKSSGKYFYNSILTKKARLLFTKKNTVYTNYGFLPDTNDMIEISFGSDGSLPFVDGFLSDSETCIKRIKENIKKIETSETKDIFEKDFELLETSLKNLQSSKDIHEEDNCSKIKLLLKVSWANDECWLEPTIIKHNNNGDTSVRKVQKGRYVDLFKLMIEPMIDNIAFQPSLWYDEENGFFTHEKNGRRLTTVKDIIEKSVKDFRSI